MSFLNKLRPRSMKRRKTKTSTTAGDIFRGTVPVPNDEPAPTMAEQMALKTAKQEEYIKKDQLASALKFIEREAARGNYQAILRYDDVYRIKDELKEMGFKVDVSVGGMYSTIMWNKK